VVLGGFLIVDHDADSGGIDPARSLQFSSQHVSLRSAPARSSQIRLGHTAWSASTSIIPM
jgi:hypothetical protein